MLMLRMEQKTAVNEMSSALTLILIKARYEIPGREMKLRNVNEKDSQHTCAYLLFR